MSIATTPITKHAVRRAGERLGMSQGDFCDWIAATRSVWQKVDAGYLCFRGVRVSDKGSHLFIVPFADDRIVAVVCAYDGAVKTVIDYREPDGSIPKYEWRCSFGEYIADASHVSRSMLEDFRYSRRYFHAKHVARSLPPEPSTDEMKFGTATHICVLEPERMNRAIRVIPQSVLASNGARSTNAYKEWAAEHDGYVLMKRAEFDALRRVVDAVWANDCARGLLEMPGPTEQTIKWLDPETSLPGKSRRDKVLSEVIVDLKTCPDSSSGAFARKCAELGYHRQAAFYVDGDEAATGEKKAFVFIAVSKEPPHDVAVYELDEADVDLGRQQNRASLAELAECYASDDWANPGESQITTIQLPKWVHHQDDWRIA
jgi:hypothetical protein